MANTKNNKFPTCKMFQCIFISLGCILFTFSCNKENFIIQANYPLSFIKSSAIKGNLSLFLVNGNSVKIIPEQGTFNLLIDLIESPNFIYDYPIEFGEKVILHSDTKIQIINTNPIFGDSMNVTYDCVRKGNEYNLVSPQMQPSAITFTLSNNGASLYLAVRTDMYSYFDTFSNKVTWSPVHFDICNTGSPFSYAKELILSKNLMTNDTIATGCYLLVYK